MVTKKAAVKTAPVEESGFSVGDVVVFKGYDDDVPEAERVLTTGQEYTVVEVNEGDGALAVQADNPDYNPKRKESQSNAKSVIVDVFFDEVELAGNDDDGDGVEDEDVDGDVDGEVDESEDEEVAPPTPPARAGTKTATNTKAPAKTATATTTKASTATKTSTATKAAPATKTAAAKAPATKAAAAKTSATTKPAAPATKGKAVSAPAGKGKLAAATKPQEVDPYPTLEEEDEEMLALINENEDLLDLAAELCAEGAALDYRIGGVLYHVRSTKQYQSLDDKYKENGGFAQYIKDHLNIEYRKAMYLIDIYYKFNLYGIDAAKVQELGWTKCSKVAAVMTEENAEDLIALAETNTVADLNDNIKESYSKSAAGASTGETRKKIMFKFRLWQDQAVGVSEVIQAAANKLGCKTLDDAFEHIVMEWAAEHSMVQQKAARKVGNATRAKATTSTKG